MSDIEIAQQAKLERIQPLAERKLGLSADDLIPYGHTKAKLTLAAIARLQDRPDGKLILVTAISPTPAGEGKTTTTVGLGDGLGRIGQRAAIALREPSMGPVFGMKGGAAGGGHAQVVPMEDINLHFTGDFAAIALAHNLLSAALDNHVHHGNALGIDVRRVSWGRVVDMNDRALRRITAGLGGPANGYPREDRFDIVVASEVMAILCLATSLADLKARLGRIVVAYTREKNAVTAADLKVHGAMAALLKDALMPNLVQTLEGTPALLHGGPFANIAHGCNSVMATRAALKLADYVVTEAGFGADLGAEKFVNIKCRKTGLRAACAVIVATVRALRYHGHGDLTAGLPNLLRHIENVRLHYGLVPIVCINRFDADTSEELATITRACAAAGASCVTATHWAEGGRGAEALAREVVRACAEPPLPYTPMYDDAKPLADKIAAVATRIYRAASVQYEPKAIGQLAELQEGGYGHFPVCIAKTPYSFGGDAKQIGAVSGHTLTVRELRLNAGAEFVTAICGDIMTMPGLPKVPAAEHIDVDDDGRISGLF
ncbi:MAG: formate--tetrahydrofolate ligase [Proteobacteria bacterium]|nr:formate--tetrahydrofolate ligase [Pseudomonadota bacterium]